jgi:hypothetical protein
MLRAVLAALAIGPGDAHHRCEKTLIAAAKRLNERANALFRPGPVCRAATALQAHPGDTRSRVLRTIGRRVLDLDRRMLVDRSNSSEERLAASEFDLLKIFAENPNRPLTRDWLLEVTAHREAEPFDRAIDLPGYDAKLRVDPRIRRQCGRCVRSASCSCRRKTDAHLNERGLRELPLVSIAVTIEHRRTPSGHFWLCRPVGGAAGQPQ